MAIRWPLPCAVHSAHPLLPMSSGHSTRHLMLYIARSARIHRNADTRNAAERHLPQAFRWDQGSLPVPRMAMHAHGIELSSLMTWSIASHLFCGEAMGLNPDCSVESCRLDIVVALEVKLFPIIGTHRIRLAPVDTSIMVISMCRHYEYRGTYSVPESAFCKANTNRSPFCRFAVVTLPPWAKHSVSSPNAVINLIQRDLPDCSCLEAQRRE